MRGTYRVTVQFSHLAWPGRWDLVSVFLTDEAGNAARYEPPWPSDLVVPPYVHVLNEMNLTYGGEDLFDYHPIVVDALNNADLHNAYNL